MKRSASARISASRASWNARLPRPGRVKLLVWRERVQFEELPSLVWARISERHIVPHGSCTPSLRVWSMQPHDVIGEGSVLASAFLCSNAVGFMDIQR